MNFEDNFISSYEQTSSPLRVDSAIPSLYDTASRDSGFDDASLEFLGDDAFLEEFAEINVSESVVNADDNSVLPSDFANLIQKPIVSVTVLKKPTLRRVIEEEGISPLKKKLCHRNEDAQAAFLIKRKKFLRRPRTEEYTSDVSVKSQPKIFSSENSIKSAIQRSYSEPDLIADFSRSYSLPQAASRHQDLRAIDTTTLRKLLSGEYSDRVSSFKIIDCRYPYEYNGGHIDGAINIYTHEQCSALLEESTFEKPAEKPSILIFHCEFSAERGPNLYRHLRQEDRRKNSQMYPSLCFPEMYILEGGYRKFFEESTSLCLPQAYIRMLDPNYNQELALFRQTSKTWDSDVKSSRKSNMKPRNIRKFVL